MSTACCRNERLVVSSDSPGLSLNVERALITIATPSFPHPSGMIFAKASLTFAVVSFAAFFCAQSAEAARGPKITSKVYFDIQHGDQPMGRSAFTSLSRPCLSNPDLMNLTVVLGLFGGVRCVGSFFVCLDSTNDVL
jgi:hypothetical protein